MAKKLRSGLVLPGISPNILLQHVENTAPFLFQGELQTDGDRRAFLAKLVFYKKNLNLLKNIDLAEYFHLCLSAHWATAGTFVPTDVDNQIRQGLWRHEQVGRHIEKMAKLTIDAWTWDYEQVTNRKSYDLNKGQVLSTHEGTWLSVAIGGYCALKRNKQPALAEQMAEAILAEISKEEKILTELREQRDHINFLRTTALMAHNFGDLDRVMDQWEMDPTDPFHQRIYKLGHRLNPAYSTVLVYAGQVNKALLSVENHRHMSMRQPKCLRRSHDFLIPVGPFMDQWGRDLGTSKKLNLEEKSEIISAFYEGHKRQDHAFGYARAYGALVNSMPGGWEDFLPVTAYDFFPEVRKSEFQRIADTGQADFEASFCQKLEQFVCPLTHQQF